jgi:glycosyltransferase involved in cell wall biosynthesis
MLPSVSLLIPCYNSEKKLPLLLQDALQQTHPFQEIIVYDDGSSDNTSLVAKQHGCKVIRGEINRGVGYARQQLLEAATAPYVHFHDSDDRMNENFLQVLSPYCQIDQAACCSLQETLTNGKTFIHTYHPINQNVDLIEYFIQNFVHMNTVIYPTKAALQAGGFRVELRTNEDRIFHYQLAVFGLSFRFINQPLVSRIRHSESTIATAKFSATVSNFMRGVEIAMEIFPEKYYKLLGEYSLYYAEKAAYRNDYQTARRAIDMAKRCGIKHLSKQGRESNFLSRLIGIEKTLFLRSRYAFLKRNFNL